MKKLFFIYLLLLTGTNYGQNVKIEIGDYDRYIDGKEYSTYQFVRSSYSHSRGTLVLITKKDSLVKLSNELPILFNSKQEYTDVWILGIENFLQKKVSGIDKKIINSFLLQIIKYRTDNNLPEYTLENLKANLVFVKKKEEMCKYFSCRNKY